MLVIRERTYRQTDYYTPVSRQRPIVTYWGPIKDTLLHIRVPTEDRILHIRVTDGDRMFTPHKSPSQTDRYISGSRQN